MSRSLSLHQLTGFVLIKVFVSIRASIPARRLYFIRKDTLIVSLCVGEGKVKQRERWERSFLFNDGVSWQTYIALMVEESNVEYGAMVERYRQGKTEVLGVRPVSVQLVYHKVQSI